MTLKDALTVTGSVSQSVFNKSCHAIHETGCRKRTLIALEAFDAPGKGSVRFAEDFILFLRDILLYKTAPNLEESLERALLDDDFKSVDKRVGL